MPTLFDRQVRAALLGLWGLAWLIIAFVMLAPLQNPLPVSHGDLIVHFVCYGVLAFAAVGFSHRAIELTLFAVLTIAGGIALEFAQGLVPYRTVDVLDMAANALGAMTGYGGAMVLLLLWIRPALEAHKDSARA
jgi:VanZ family protein